MVLRYLDRSADGIVWDLIRTAFASVADTSVVPLQDLLELPGEFRMNRPGTGGGNWSWRCREGLLTVKLARRLLELTELYGRVRIQ